MTPGAHTERGLRHPPQLAEATAVGSPVLPATPKAIDAETNSCRDASPKVPRDAEHHLDHPPSCLFLYLLAMNKFVNQKPKLIVVVGPTASGKSALAVRLAKKFTGEIISADSRQIYRGMDIGTAKPVRDTRAGISFYSEGIRHHLIDIKNPDQDYTVAEYKKDAIAAIRQVIKRKKLPILVGGTGLYIQAVTENLDIPHVPPNPHLRLKLEDRLKRESLSKLFEDLVRLDPEAAYVVDGKNPRRVLRALEVAISTGRPFTVQRRKSEPLFRTLKLGIHTPPAILRNRINARVREMVWDGLAKEVGKLVKKYGAGRRALDTIGYREVVPFLKGGADLVRVEKDIQRNTWRYAKRQMTWFRRDKDTLWVKDAKEAEKLVKKFLS